MDCGTLPLDTLARRGRPNRGFKVSFGSTIGIGKLSIHPRIAYICYVDVSYRHKLVTDDSPTIHVGSIESPMRARSLEWRWIQLVCPIPKTTTYHWMTSDPILKIDTLTCFCYGSSSKNIWHSWGSTTAYNITTWSLASELDKKAAIRQTKQDHILPCSASNVLGRVLAM